MMHVRSGKQTQNREALEEDVNNPMTATHLCTSCYLLGKEPYMLPVKQFGVHKADDFFNYIYLMANGQSAWDVNNAQEYTRKKTFPKVTRSVVKKQHMRRSFVYCATRKEAGRHRWLLVYMAAGHATTLLMQVFGRQIR